MIRHLKFFPTYLCATLSVLLYYLTKKLGKTQQEVKQAQSNLQVAEEIIKTNENVAQKRAKRDLNSDDVVRERVRAVAKKRVSKASK